MRTLKHEWRVMKRGELYEIEEKIGGANWAVICECATVNEAKGILKSLKTLDGEEEANDE